MKQYIDFLNAHNNSMNLLTTLTPNGDDEKISAVGKYNPRLITGDKFVGLDENLKPVLRDDLVLPCGIYGKWVSND